MSTTAVKTFLALPTNENLQELLSANPQEYDNLDFKEEWIEFDKVSKHLLALGNTGGDTLAELKMLYAYLYQFDTMFSYDNYPSHSDDLVSDLEIQGNQFITQLRQI